MVAGDYGEMLHNGEPSSGLWHLERLIRENLADACAHWFAGRRKLVIALGTNDVPRKDVSGLGAALAVVALHDRAAQVPCVDVYVATIPPRLHMDAAKIALANATIQVRVPAERVILFGSQPVTDLDDSGVHMREIGQDHRADLALRVLFP